LLNSILRVSEKNKITKLKEFKNNKVNKEKNLFSKYESALRNFSGMSNSSKKLEKYKFIRQLRNAKLTLKYSNDLGFKCRSELWKNCLKDDRKKGKNFEKFLTILSYYFILIIGGQPPIGIDLKKSIDTFMKSESEIASNRFVTIKNESGINEKKNVRYCQLSFIESYQKFPNNHLLKYSTFYKYIPKIYKKPNR
jgi:hypothetical protein